MSLFTKTIVVPGGLTKRDAETLREVFEVVAARFKDQEKQIEELRADLKQLKTEPRTSLLQRIKARGN